MMHQDLYMEGHAMGTVKGYKVAGEGYQAQENQPGKLPAPFLVRVPDRARVNYIYL